MKIVKFDDTKAAQAIQKALSGHQFIDLSGKREFTYEDIYHIKTCDFMMNYGTFGSDHPTRQWTPETDKTADGYGRKFAHFEFRNSIANMFAKYFNKPLIVFESATLSRVKNNYDNRHFKLIKPRYYRMGLGHCVWKHTKWCKPIEGRLEEKIKEIEESNTFKIQNIFNHQWKNNKDGSILILPGLEDDPTSSTPVEQWVTESVKEIRQHTDRKIVVKAHPVSKLTYDNLKQIPNVEIYIGKNTIGDMAKDTYCGVLDSSTSIFQLIELGIPTFTTVYSFGYPLGNFELSKIENIHYANSNDVYKWYKEMISTEFTMKELEDPSIIERIEELING